MSRWSLADRRAMRRALQLAAQGLTSTQPNPRVGCVLLQGEERVGEGFHERAGEPHAEVHALRAAGARARGATAYVTLEPCAHQGRTPPCTDALIAAGVARVVYASGDPDPRVNGRGAARLQSAGISVEHGLLAAAAEDLNCGFFRRVRSGRPWVRVKLAASLDGRTGLANGTSKWITSAAARADVQHWRARSCALVTGIGTVLADDPLLTVRPPAAVLRQPLRIVLDSSFRTPPTAGLLRTGGAVQIVGVEPAAASALTAALTLTLAAPGTDARTALRAAPQIECMAAGADGRVDLPALLQRLGAAQINELQVEAGATLSGALLASGLADELLLYLAPSLLGQDARPLAELPLLTQLTQRLQWRIHGTKRVGSDLRLLLRPQGS